MENKSEPFEVRLMTQIEARAEAKRLNAQGIPAIAGTVPLGAWGGHEKGWTVYLATGPILAESNNKERN